jgi:glutamyl-tRNA synthetase
MNTALDPAKLKEICGLFKERCQTLVELADWASIYASEPKRDEADATQHLTDAARAPVQALAQVLGACEWNKDAIGAAVKAAVAQAGVKMPQIAMPARVLLTGRAQTPSLDAVIALFDRATVLSRLSNF